VYIHVYLVCADWTIFSQGCQSIDDDVHVEKDEDGNEHTIARVARTQDDEDGTANNKEVELEILDGGDVCMPTQFLWSHGGNSKANTFTIFEMMKRQSCKA
jgi:hypothetical protein